ncbi:MAG: peptidase M28, partial [Sphingorhabdus sp.]
TGYRVYWRRADQQGWEQSSEVQGLESTSTLLKGLIVDDHFVGVSATDSDGNESMITFAGLPARR